MTVLTLPEPLQRFAAAQATEKGFDSPESWIRDLIQREADKQRFRQEMLDAMAEPTLGECDEEWFGSLRKLARDGA